MSLSKYLLQPSSSPPHDEVIGRTPLRKPLLNTLVYRLTLEKKSHLYSLYIHMYKIALSDQV